VSESINPIVAAWRVRRAIRRTALPRPVGTGTVDHEGFRPVLEAVRSGGVSAIPRPALESYLATLSDIDPDQLTREHALAYWLNLYNAGALEVAEQAAREGSPSVLRVKGAFEDTTMTIAGEALSLDGIEHGKVRRFGDPRIHAALVCGAISCPTLRFEPFDGAAVEAQLDDQIRSFLAGGGSQLVDDTLRLSRIFLWYSGDFVRKMPAWRPATKKDLLQALREWLPAGSQSARKITFMRYDWALGCAVR